MIQDRINDNCLRGKGGKNIGIQRKKRRIGKAPRRTGRIHTCRADGGATDHVNKKMMTRVSTRLEKRTVSFIFESK